MADRKTVEFFLVRVECEKPVNDLIDLVANRVFTLDGVTDVTATRVEQITLEPNRDKWKVNDGPPPAFLELFKPL